VYAGDAKGADDPVAESVIDLAAVTLDRRGRFVAVTLVEPAQGRVHARPSGPPRDQNRDCLARLPCRPDLRYLLRCEIGRALERRILAQNPVLQSLQGGTRGNPEVLVERPVGFLVGLQRLCLAAAAVERQHELPAQALAKRVGADQGFQLTHQIRVGAECKVRVDAILDRSDPQLLQARDLALGEGLVDEVRQRRPSPERQRIPQPRRRFRHAACSRGPRFSKKPLEALRVELIRLDLEQVPRRARQQPPVLVAAHPARVEHLPELGDVHL
jgi:hypothetical protein